MPAGRQYRSERAAYGAVRDWGVGVGRSSRGAGGHERPRDFLRAEASPFSLAVFRIVLFAVILRMALLMWPVSVSYAGLPRSSIVPPWKLGRVLDVTPISPGLARAAGAVLVAACVCGILGLYARSAAAVATVSGIYFLGLPGFFGKVDHGAHVLWFAALLAVSPCADVLSVDGARRAWRRADTGDVAPPRPSRAYGVPLRLVWLLIGALYFFPGLWKLRSDGLHWAWSDNLRNIAYAKWVENGHRPALASVVDNDSVVRVAAVAAVLFELCFVLLVLWRRTRVAAVVAGLAFHLANRVFLQIDFWPLYSLYVVFVPWDRAFGWAGRRLFPERSVGVYDDGCGICRRTVATLNSLDVLGRVTWTGASVAEVGVARADLLADLHYVEGDRVSKAFDAYRRIARRYPLLWPVLPFLYVPPVAALGRRVYRHVAGTRACAVAPLPAPAGETLCRPRPRAVTAVFATVALPALFLGLAGREQAWPVSMYPAFRGYHPPTLPRITATVDGLPYDLRAATSYGPSAWTRLSRRMAATDPDGRAEQARGLYAAAVARHPELRGRRVVVLLATISTRPSDRDAPPLASEIVAELS